MMTSRLFVLLTAIAVVFSFTEAHAQTGTPTILVLDWGSMEHRAQLALDGLGYSYTLTTNESEFLAQLGTTDWDLVVVDNPYQPFTDPTPLAAFLDSGVGRVIVSYWNADDPAYAPVITDRLGGVPITDVFSAQALDCWNCTDGAWNRVTPITTVPVGLEIWFDDGDEFEATGTGVAIGGFGGATPTPGRAGLIRSQPGHVAYLLGTASDNMAPVAQLALWQNLIETCLDTPDPDCLPVYDLEVTDVSCTTDPVLLTWTVNSPLFSAIEIERNGTLIATIGGSEEQFLEVGVPDGTHVYTVRPVCGGTPAPERSVVVQAVSTGGHRNIVVRLESDAGMIDSATALENALDALGEAWIEVDALDGSYCYDASTVFWVMAGTYPADGTLLPAAGNLLRDHAVAGGKIYFESGLHWEFGAPTAFAQVDGVEDFPSPDLQPGFTSVIGLTSGIGWDAASFGAVPYSPDQMGSDSDRVRPTESDALGAYSVAAWLDGAAQYSVGTAYVGDNGARVVCHGWEFGGFGGSQAGLAQRLVSFLRGPELPCYPVHALEMATQCWSPAPVVRWESPTLGTLPTEGYEVYRDGVLIASVSGTTEFLDVDAPLGVPVTYGVRTLCAGGQSSAVVELGTIHTSPGVPANMILRLDYGMGLVDSASAIGDALTGLGQEYTEVTSVDDVTCLHASTVLWVVTGTFPDHFALDDETAAFITGHIISGGGVFFEGGDTWGFDPQTAFAEMDGVGAAQDGNDSLFTLTGVDGVLALSGFAGVPYTQDQIGNDSNDRLFPATEDTFGTNVSLTWRMGPAANEGVGVAYQTYPSRGNVVCQSWELGGFEGDLEAVVATYRDFLAVVPPIARFLRGDANADGVVDISDPIATVGALFSGLGFFSCREAYNSNGDTVITIADAIYTLAYLVQPGSPSPPAPFPSCGWGTVYSSCDAYPCP